MFDFQVYSQDIPGHLVSKEGFQNARPKLVRRSLDGESIQSLALCQHLAARDINFVFDALDLDRRQARACQTSLDFSECIAYSLELEKGRNVSEKEALWPWLRL